MGKIQLLSKEQKLVLDEISRSEFLSSNFYFTGGTALSAFYLKHRFSDDLDFFSREKFDNQILFTLVEEWSRKFNFTFGQRFVEVVYIFDITFKNGTTLKLDFAYYPSKQLKPYTVSDGISVDSLLDIAVTKLLVISQRSEVKDFVDLYFLLKKYTFWDLMEGIKVKFHVKLDPLLLAADLLKVDDFDYLPKMIKPLKLTDLKQFFRERAQEISGRFTE